MNAPANIALRNSCLVARAQACVTGFERLGKRCSADTTRGFLAQIQAAPSWSPLWEHQIGEQEARLASFDGLRIVESDYE